MLVVLFGAEDAVGYYVLGLLGLLGFYAFEVGDQTGAVVGVLVNADASDELFFAACHNVVGREQFVVFHPHPSCVFIGLAVSASAASCVYLTVIFC